MHQNRFRLGLHPRPRWGSLQHSLRSPSLNKGDLLLIEGEGCREGGGERERSEGKGREEREDREGKGTKGGEGRGGRRIKGG